MNNGGLRPAGVYKNFSLVGHVVFPDHTPLFTKDGKYVGTGINAGFRGHVALVMWNGIESKMSVKEGDCLYM